MSRPAFESVERVRGLGSARVHFGGGSAARLFALAAVVTLVTFAAGASAHRVGLSRGEYAVSSDEVRSRLTFARSELEARFGGALGSDPARGDLDSRAAEAVGTQLRVEMAGRPCRTVLESIDEVAPDGIRIALRHPCPASGDVVFHSDFVDALEPGHRHVAEVTSASRTTTFVAYRGNASFAVGQAPGVSEGRPPLGFFWMGIEHILTGWDHLAFLLGVALMPFRLRASDPGSSARSRMKSLALAVTAFTVAHSLTLSLGVLGVTNVSPRWVEPLIALSVAYLGVEGLFSRRTTAPYRMTFAFGLVHGMGFAGALREVAIPRAHVPGALALFNAGVEIGQLVALGPVVAALVLLSSRPARLPRVLGVASAALALGGAGLFVGRVVTAAEEAVAARAPASARGPGAADSATAAHGGVRAPRETDRGKAGHAGAATVMADVERLCGTINELPRRRRAECSGGAPGVAFGLSCARILGRAVASDAISLSPEEVAACAASLAERYETCAFLDQGPRVREPACERILHGARVAGQACASSLECRPGLFCDGAGPLDAGVCRAPKDSGAACGLGIDPLAGYVQIATDDTHRECAGECVQYRCRERKSPVARSPSEERRAGPT